MSTIDSIVLEVTDPQAAAAFYEAAFGLGQRIRVRATQAPTSGFRGYTLSLVVAQPNIVDLFVDAAVAAGASVLKPAVKSFWGYGGVVIDPYGTIWKIASSSKKNTAAATRTVDEVVLLLGVDDVAVTKRFYTEQGLTVAKSYGRKYVEFATDNIKLALYGRKAAAKDAGVPIDGTGSHRVVVNADAGTFTDPDGFAWQADAATPAHPGAQSQARVGR